MFGFLTSCSIKEKKQLTYIWLGCWMSMDSMVVDSAIDDVCIWSSLVSNSHFIHSTMSLLLVSIGFSWDDSSMQAEIIMRYC